MTLIAPDIAEHELQAKADRIREGHLTTAERRLLRLLADWDSGDGVHFADQPRGRNLHPATGATFNDRTFRPLHRAGLINVGDGRRDPVRITDTGRVALSNRKAA